MKLIVDAMGGDFAPQAILEGVIQALPELKAEVVLVGSGAVLQTFLAKRRFRPLVDRVKFVQASENIEMSDSIRALRSKPGASINVGCRLAAEDWKNNKQSAFISAGHSGAVMGSALLNMGRLRGIERPAIAVKLPTLSPDGCILLDVGANVDCKPENLRDFAIMGAHFAHVERKNPNPPKVAVFSNGEEPTKGNELTRSAMKLIMQEDCFKKTAKFIGYVEGKDLFKGHIDVVVMDGFVGNVVLKSLEGLGSAVVTLVKREAKLNPLGAIGFLFSANIFRALKKRLDYAEYGAAPLLGVAGYAFVCHGASRAKAIKNALLRCQTALKSRFVEHLEQSLNHYPKKEIAK